MHLFFCFIMNILILSSCALQDEYYWYKKNMDLTEFYQNRYTCLQQSQQSASSASSYNNYSSSQTQTITNKTLFNSCMNSFGYRYLSKRYLLENNL